MIHNKRDSYGPSSSMAVRSCVGVVRTPISIANASVHVILYEITMCNAHEQMVWLTTSNACCMQHEVHLYYCEIVHAYDVAFVQTQI